jgi:hypothetical protein
MLGAGLFKGRVRAILFEKETLLPPLKVQC